MLEWKKTKCPNCGSDNARQRFRSGKVANIVRLCCDDCGLSWTFPGLANPGEMLAAEIQEHYRKEDEEQKEKWIEMLRIMISDYRRLKPEDKRTDRELLESLMEHFYKEGLVGKKDGKWVLPKFSD